MKTLWNKLLRPGSDALPGMRPLTDSPPSQPQRTPTAPSAGVLQQGSPAPQSHLASVISNVMSPRAATRQPAAAAASTFDTDEWKQTQQTRAVYSWQPPALPPLPVATADFSEYGYGGAKYMAAAVRGGPGAAAPPPPKRSKLEAPPPPLPLALDLLLPAQADIDDAFDETFESQADGVWLGVRPASRLTLRVKAKSLGLRFDFASGDSVHFELPGGALRRFGFSFTMQPPSEWPPIFFTGALCVIETYRLPQQQERQLHGAVHWASHEPQERALACFNMEMDGARLLSRIISSHPSFKLSWQKFSVYEHDEYLIGRHGADWMAAHGGGGGGGGGRPAAPSQALPRLKAPVNFPEGDPDAVSIDNSDLRRLEPGEFLNDNLIDFCLKQLRADIPADQAHRFHFFNCFFFQKLRGEEEDALGEGASHADRARAAHARVARWSARTNVFDKDFIVIPVNQWLHWTLAIVCNPGAAAAAAPPAAAAGASAADAIELDAPEEVIDVDAPPPPPPPPPPARTPLILQLDSMGSSHRNVEGVLRDWLAVEWAAKHRVSVEEGIRLFSSPAAVPFVRADVPQQPNSCDCGLFLAEFARRFCLTVPDIPIFSPQPRLGFPYFLRRDWFKPHEAGLSKRRHIHKSVLALAGQVAPPPPLPGVPPRARPAAAAGGDEVICLD